MSKARLAGILVVVFLFVFSAYFFGALPEKMVSHWGLNGDADGYLPKPIALFLVPVIGLFLLALFVVIPKIDPLGKNIEAFGRHYDAFVIVFLLFLCLVQFFVVFWNLGFKVRAELVFPVGLGGLFFFVGFLLEKSKRNWFVGIRTPWTLSSDVVWEKTHWVGSRLFMVSGVLSVIGLLFEGYSFFFVIVPVIVSAVFLVFYSYFVFRQERAGSA